MKKTIMTTFLTLTLAAASHGAAPAAGGSSFTCEGGWFSITVPEGWTQIPPSGQPASQKKVYGLDLLGPAGGDIAPSITVKYFARGNKLFKTYEKYVMVNSRPFGDPEEGEVYSKVTDARVAGKHALSFERKHFEYQKPRTVPPARTSMFERHLVVPAGSGFYVLKFSAPFERARDLLPAFEAVQKSFRPAKRK